MIRVRTGSYDTSENGCQVCQEWRKTAFSSILGTFVRQVEIRGHTILDLDGSFVRKLR